MGYGLFSPEKDYYRSYLDFVANQIGEDLLDKVVVSGGFTDVKQQDKSEAATIREYLTSVVSGFDNYVLEENSINTNQNIAFSAKEIGEEDEVFIYCDLLRLAKVAWIAMHFILGRSQKEIAEAFLDYEKARGVPIDIHKPFKYDRLKVTGFEFSGKFKETSINQLLTSLVDVIALYNDEVNKLDEENRKELFGL